MSLEVLGLFSSHVTQGRLGHVCAGLIAVSLLCVDHCVLTLLIPVTVQHKAPKDPTVAADTQADPRLTHRPGSRKLLHLVL